MLYNIQGVYSIVIVVVKNWDSMEMYIVIIISIIKKFTAPGLTDNKLFSNSSRVENKQVIFFPPFWLFLKLFLHGIAVKIP